MPIWHSFILVPKGCTISPIFITCHIAASQRISCTQPPYTVLCPCCLWDRQETLGCVCGVYGSGNVIFFRHPHFLVQKFTFFECTFYLPFSETHCSYLINIMLCQSIYKACLPGDTTCWDGDGMTQKHNVLEQNICILTIDSSNYSFNYLHRGEQITP